MGDFFDNLKNNLKTLELKYLTSDYIKFLNGQNSSTKKDIEENQIKPSGTVAFLHALRAYRPTNRIRNLVAMEPEAYRGSNYFDPSYQWTGLGK